MKQAKLFLRDKSVNTAETVLVYDKMRAMSGVRKLLIGGVRFNEPFTSRVDLMPFSRVKQIGCGCECSNYAMAEMTEERLITISLS